MNTPILSVKLHIPTPRPKTVQRPRLLKRLNEGLHRKLTLISASAGFGKTMLVSEWLADCKRPAAWLSLDERDNDPIRFLTYLVAALQTISANIGKGVSAMLQSNQAPPTESILAILLNEMTATPEKFILVLDDYHHIHTKSVDDALSFLLEHLPSHLHVVIATRKDTRIPLSRIRVQDQLTELRGIDLRFTRAEAAEFLNEVMGLSLSLQDIGTLETRTEGWIAGLQLAALSLQGHHDPSSFIQLYTGSHHFVLDFLLEEVLQQQPDNVQDFLLRTSILDRFCGSLCDAVILPHPSFSGQETLEYLDRANLFIVPLDYERRWYRYHHLFADLLRQRLQQRVASTAGDERKSVAQLHVRASRWYEDNGLKIEAFHHAIAANDVENAARLMEGDGMPLHFLGGVAPALSWLASQPTHVLDSRPSLWVVFASALLMVGQLNGVEQKLQSAEIALQWVESNVDTRDLIGQIAAIRATLAVSQHKAETIITQSRSALELLHPNNLIVRTVTTWTLGYAYQIQGNRTAASQAFTEAVSVSQAIGHIIITLLATIGLGNIQESNNQLDLAAETYRHVVHKLAGDLPMPVVCEAHLGLARIHYEWNDLDAAELHVNQSIELARQLENTDRFISCEVLLARLKLAQRDIVNASAILAKSSQAVHRYDFVNRMPEVAAAQVLSLLYQNNLVAASQLAYKHDLPMSRARVHLAQGDTDASMAVLAPLYEQMAANGWKDECLKVMVFQSIVLRAHGEKDKAVQLLGDALMLAETGGFIRIFVDEGIPMARLLSEAAAHGMMPNYIGKLLAVFKADEQQNKRKSDLNSSPPVQAIIEPLSERELKVLQLINQGLSNREISQQLFLALDTIKGHNRRIYEKLQVQRRTEALARARELGLL